MTSPPTSASLFDDPDLETVEGEVQKVVYENAEGGWAVIRLSTARGVPATTAVGILYGVRPGERLRLSGSWEEDRKFGRQFRVEAFLSLLPSTRKGIERYLGSGLIRGIGAVMAQRLVERFGMETLDIIEHQPERLSEVSGIGAHRASQIRLAWQQQKGVREVLIFLQGHGVSLGQAIKIHRQYGQRALSVIRANPYKLAEDIFGFGFQTADRIAARLGVARDAPDRLAAGLGHALTQAESQGHLYLPEEQLIRRASELLEQPADLVGRALERLAETQQVIQEETSGAEGSRACFHPLLFLAEKSLASRLGELIARPETAISPQWQTDLAAFEARQGIELSARQRDAVGRSLAASVLIITGGPGTGKTTLIRAVTEFLRRSRKRLLLSAPTGRAAKRLAEATGHEAMTLHRLLEFEPRTRQFQRHSDRPLEADVIIVDETSMLDCSLARHLIEAMPAACRLILVGDVDQLPSVGPGRVLADLIDSQRIPVVRLDEVFRQASRSLIVSNAHRIRQGRMPQLAADREADFFYIERHQPEEILETIDHLVDVRIPRGFDLDPRRDIQLLAPMRRGLIGVEELNRRLQRLLAAESPIVEPGGSRFREGDRIMQIRNNYDLDIFNGDIGWVVGPSADGESLRVLFDGRPVDYPATDTDQLVLAYACSIHKAQGSEYPCVVVPLHSQHHIMLQRNLLYTAVTRGRRLVVVVGEPRALARAVRNDRQQIRFTRLTERLLRT